MYRTPPMLSASFTPQGKKVQQRLEHIFAKRKTKGSWLLPVTALMLLMVGSMVACVPVMTAVSQPEKQTEAEKPVEEAVTYRSPLSEDTTIQGAYGVRVHPVTGVETVHSGVDLSADEGDPVLAAADGTVVSAEFTAVYGNCVVLAHENGQESFYGHMKQASVEAGQTVYAGDEIGQAGQTGLATAPHLHFEIRENGATLDPTDIVS